MTRILLAMAVAFALAGCNTVEGLGKDIKKGGEKIEKVGGEAQVGRTPGMALRRTTSCRPAPAG